MSIIESERLVLRELELNDAPFILQLLNEASFLRFIGDKGVRTLADARDYIEKGPRDSYRRLGFGLYLTSLRDSGVAAGICGLVKRETLADADIGYAFLPQHRSKGYATEAAAAVLAHAKLSLRLDRVVAITSHDNHASVAVLEKIGLVFERTVKLTADGPELKLFGCGSWPDP
ncbi:MAG TPA: GNAT family N-acetyltransferase [Steroidobacteraceae bacterium]|jgi:ribosomal-protein-alanine N-acetyltransferase